MTHAQQKNDTSMNATKTLLTGAAIVAGGAAVAALSKKENRKKVQDGMKKAYSKGEELLNKTVELSGKYLDEHPMAQKAAKKALKTASH